MNDMNYWLQQHRSCGSGARHVETWLDLGFVGFFLSLVLMMIFKQTELTITLQLFDLGSFNLFVKVNPFLIHGF
jgi:hypothetical protein